MVTKLNFILASNLFFLFITQMTALIGQSGIITGFNPEPIFSFTGISILDIFIGVINNLGVFVSFLSIGSTISLFSGVVLTSWILTWGWMIMELIRGV